uniref:Gustatory receptor n=1 Tax=Heliothis virescens TaxID=7102 RepID=A0A2A4K1I4_HELVI
MKITVANKTIKDTFYTIAPVNWVLRVFNLSCIYRENGELKASWSLTKSITYVIGLAFVNVLFLITNFERWDSILQNWFSLTFADAIQMTYFIGYVEYITDLVFVIKKGREGYLKYFKTFDHIDQLLGMNSYDEIRKLILKIVGVCIIMFVVSSTIDHISWVDGYKSSSTFLFSLNYFYFFLNMLTALDGMCHVVQLEYRLKLMKELLENYYHSPNHTISNDDDKTWATKIDSGSSRVDSLKTLNYSRFTEVIGFNRCYLLLVEQAYFLNGKFGIRLLVLCINFLVNMIKLLNLFVRFATGAMVSPNGTSRLLSFASMVRLLNWAIVAFIVVYRCEQMYKQSERILDIIDLVLVNKKNSTNLTTTLEKLRNLLLTRPIKFHAAQFFTVEYTLLVSLVSTIVTYTIIMLQNLN